MKYQILKVYRRTVILNYVEDGSLLAQILSLSRL